MKVSIRGTEVDYVSDYPDGGGWQFSAGDPFKFPVQLAGQPCFIKRFEKKKPEYIPGWDFLQRMKGVQEPNLPMTFDIVKTQEKGKDIYYLFQEYLEGATVEEQIAKGNTLNLDKLNSDLFTALASVHRHENWFVDFCEKNIFAANNGNFYLVDLDSTQPLTDAPNNDMFGSKDYWIPVYNFYRLIRPQSPLKLSDLDGASLNYLQVVFLILRMKQYYKQKTQSYNSEELHAHLPEQLNKIGGFSDLFLEVLKYQGKGLPAAIVQSIKNAIDTRILRDAPPPMVSTSKLSIRSFTASSTKLGKGEPLTLTWNAEGATKVELVRNGVVFETFAADRNSFQRREFYDDVKKVVYELVAYAGDQRVKSEPLTIELKKEGEAKPSFKKVFLILGIVLGFVLLYLLFNSLRTKPSFSLSTDDGFLYEGSMATFFATNLDDHQVDVFFNGIAAGDQEMSGDTLTVTVPKLESANIDDAVVITVVDKESGKEYFHKQASISNSTVNLIEKALQPAATWTGCVLNANNEDCDQSVKLPMPGTSSDINGFVISDNYTMEDQKVHKALFTHPWWTGNGSIKGSIPLTNPSGKLTFKASLGFVGNADAKTIDGVTFKVKAFYGRKKGHIFDKLKTGEMELQNRSIISNIIAIHPSIAALAGPREFLIASIAKTYDGTLTEISKELPPSVPNKFTLELRVDAGPTSNVDWAAWVNPRIEIRAIRL